MIQFLVGLLSMVLMAFSVYLSARLASRIDAKFPITGSLFNFLIWFIAAFVWLLIVVCVNITFMEFLESMIYAKQGPDYGWFY